MKYDRFEDLPVWKSANDLALGALELLEDAIFTNRRRVREQFDDACTSIGNNIAEGFERGTSNELLMFIYIARGSAGEARSMLHQFDGWPRAIHLKSHLSNLTSLAESCSRQLRAWADHVQNSDIKGPRHLNDNSREQYESKRRADVFLENLKKMVPRPWETNGEAAENDDSPR